MRLRLARRRVGLPAGLVAVVCAILLTVAPAAYGSASTSDTSAHHHLRTVAYHAVEATSGAHYFRSPDRQHLQLALDAVDAEAAWLAAHQPSSAGAAPQAATWPGGTPDLRRDRAPPAWATA